MTPALPIERLRPCHAASYRALMLQAYAAHPDAYTASAAERAALPPAWWEARLAEQEDAAGLVLGAFDGRQLAGVAGLAFESRDKLRHKARLFGMYVPEPYRRRGLGRRLVDAVLAHARGRAGIVLVQLSVTEGNAAAESLYRRCGFAAFGVEPMAVAVGAGFVSKVHMWHRIAPSSCAP